MLAWRRLVLAGRSTLRNGCPDRALGAAVERNLRFPDLSGLDVLVGAPVSSEGHHHDQLGGSSLATGELLASWFVLTAAQLDGDLVPHTGRDEEDHGVDLEPHGTTLGDLVARAALRRGAEAHWA